MNSRRLTIGLALSAMLLVGGGLTASAHSSSNNGGRSIFQSVHHSVSDLLDLPESMRDINDAHVVGFQIFNDLQEALRFSQAQARGRLIHDDDARTSRNGSSNFDELLLRD